MSRTYEPKQMATVDEVRELILSACPGADVSTIREERQRITGEVRWAGFGGWSDQRRRDHVTKRVRHRLGTRGINIGLLFLLTPDESLDD